MLLTALRTKKPVLSRVLLAIAKPVALRASLPNVPMANSAPVGSLLTSVLSKVFSNPSTNSGGPYNPASGSCSDTLLVGRTGTHPTYWSGARSRAASSSSWVMRNPSLTPMVCNWCRNAWLAAILDTTLNVLRRLSTVPSCPYSPSKLRSEISKSFFSLRLSIITLWVSEWFCAMALILLGW